MVTRAVRQWWTRTNDQHLLSAQEKLLTSFVRSPLLSVEKKHGLNVVAFGTDPKNSRQLQGPLPTVILLHGFGSGLGFFFRNIDPLLDSGKVGRVLLVDWLGMGASDRPPCRRPIRGFSDCTTAWCQSRFNPSQAVDFFLDPLHQVLQEELVEEEPAWCIGHSLGGYLLARYFLKNSHDKSARKLEKIILASPVGFPIKPTNLLPPAQLPTVFRLVDALWSANVTPQQLVRMMGATRGRNAVRRALAGRIPHLATLSSISGGDGDDDILDVLANYLYHITTAHPSGEFAINSLLEPGVSPDMAGVFAREPLEPLFLEYAQKQQLNGSDGMQPQWKILFGDKDWMRPNEPSAIQALGAASVSIVPNAGHHLYLDNVQGFVQHILQ